MRIAICDDSEKDRTAIKKWFTENYPEIKNANIVEFEGGWPLLDYMSKVAVDLVCLDGQMTGLDGIEVLEAIRNQVGDTLVIIISNFTEYSVRSHEFKIFMYILKPDFNDKAPRTFQRAFRELLQNNESAYWYKWLGSYKRFNIIDVAYVESKKNNLTFITKDDDSYRQFNTKLDVVQQQFQPFGFIRCHQSYLVNERNIVQFERYQIHLINGTVLPISQDRYTAIQRIILMRETEVKQ